MKRTILLLLSVLLLAACTAVTPSPAPTATPLPSPTPPPTATPTPTPVPTATPTPTPMPIPTLPPEQAGGLSGIPDPKISNPELFDITNPDSPIIQYTEAMKMVGIEVTTQQILDALNDPNNFQAKTDVNGNKYFQFLHTSTNDGINFSVAFIYDEENGWRQATIGNLGILKGIEFGTEASGWLLGDSNAFNLAKEQVNKVTISDVNWGSIEAKKGRYNFSGLDRQVSKWTKANKEIRGPALLFPSASWAMPSWLKDGNYSKDELTIIIKDYITAVINHGKNKGIKEWIVVNEPYLTKYREDDIFYKAFNGYDYIEIAFQAAREADPSATLIYNDTDNHDSSGLTTALTKKIIERLKNKGLVDAVGIQGHLGDWAGVPNSDNVIATLKSYGLPVIVTEFDFNLKGVPGSTEQREITKAKVYRDFLRAALEAGVKDFTFWGLDEKNSWLEKSLGQNDADPTMFDADFNPKPAYYAIINVLLETSQ